MSDERASFMKSTHSLSAADQLNALASTARGDKNRNLDLDDGENESHSSQSLRQRPDSMRPSTAGSGSRNSARNSWRESRNRVGPSPFAADAPRNSPLNPGSGRNSPAKQMSVHPPPSMSEYSGPPSPGLRSPNSASPWQRGAGYDHA